LYLTLITSSSLVAVAAVLLAMLAVAQVQVVTKNHL